MRTFVVLAAATHASASTAHSHVHVRSAVQVDKPSCNYVSVVGDAVYCVQGSICGANGDVCPSKGAVAVADCIHTVNSFVEPSKCIAPFDSICQVLAATGTRACVWNKVTLPPANATTRTPRPRSTYLPLSYPDCFDAWAQCHGPSWTKPMCCKDPSFQCTHKNDTYAACEPKEVK
ncbi:Aste57867_10926 [Aphanomyces stellatus]|uniref:Aste57867_10926 protein n=1 Tax=Aphanomyces stellatus TaxID=120398 RepID=A0A485KRN6_9STRA|nr:hypothetical protein As57867_010886 [Aphanomyces stellatus]VFT87794.1 Aste57867_10926 [Aphanomyces stellatus]